MLSEAKEKWGEIIYEYESNLNGIVDFFILKKCYIHLKRINKL